MAIDDGKMEEARKEIVKATLALDEAKKTFEREAEDIKSKTSVPKLEEIITAKTKPMAEVIDKLNKEVNDMHEHLLRPGAGMKGSDKDNAIAASAMRKKLLQMSGEKTPEFTNEEKAFITGDDSLGGVLVPTPIQNTLIPKVVEFSPVRQKASVYSISQGASLEMPKETAHHAAAWVAELATRSETTGDTYGKVLIPVHEHYSFLKASYQMLEDTQFPLEQWMSNKAARQFAKLEGTAFISGNGVGRPKGILSESDIATVTSDESATFNFSDIITTEYRSETSAGITMTPFAQGANWCFARNTIGVIRDFRDSQNRHIIGVDLASGMPKTIDGYPFFEAIDMPEIAASAEVGIFGNFMEGYAIVDRLGMMLIRDIYSAKTSGQVDFLFRRRVGGQVVNLDAFRILACGA